MLKSLIYRGILPAALALSAQPILAMPLESLPVLEQDLREKLGLPAWQAGDRPLVDRRLRLKKCPVSPEIEQRRENLAIVSCPALHWRISVVLPGQVQARGYRAVNEMAVRRGQPVLLVARKGGFTVSQQMIADRNGRLGDVIPVKADRKSSPILAEIVGPGRVELPAY